MKRIYLWIVCLFFALPTMVSAQAVAYDKEKPWPDGSAMSVGAHYSEIKDDFMRLLKRQQIVLLSLVDDRSYSAYGNERLVEAVRSQHQAYIDYVENESELIGSLSGAGGTWPSTYAVQCEATMIERRYRRVSDAVHCIQALPKEDRENRQQTCLYQLAQLNMGEWKQPSGKSAVQ